MKPTQSRPRKKVDNPIFFFKLADIDNHITDQKYEQLLLVGLQMRFFSVHSHTMKHEQSQFSPETAVDKMFLYAEVANSAEVALLAEVIGLQAVLQLKILGSRIFVLDNMVKLKTKHVDAAQVKDSLLFKRYERSAFLTVVDERVLIVHIWIRRNSYQEIISKVVQMDFMFFADWENFTESSEASYHKTIPASAQAGAGLYTEARGFLTKVRNLLELVDRECTIKIAAADTQRERLFRRMFKDLPNVRFD